MPFGHRYSPNIPGLISKLNKACYQALENANGVCLQRGNYTLEVEHWLLKLAEVKEYDLSKIFAAFEIDRERFLEELNLRLDRLKRGNAERPTIGPRLLDLISQSWLIASLDFGSQRIASGHVLCALLTDEAFRSIAEMDLLHPISTDELAKSLKELTAESFESELETAYATANPGKSAERITEPASTTALGQFTVDLTKEAADGRIDRIVGRDSEIRQMIDILLRRRQNNPILTGEAGVGKTAVVEGLAVRIAAGQVPDKLKGTRLLSLDISALQAGASVKGEFERRVKAVMDEVRESARPVILFIDEAHTMIGAGGAAGQGDIANLLKPALARGELRTIGATTWAEYKKFIAKDPALERRFQVVKVAEPDIKQAVEMMRAVVPRFEEHHQVVVLSEATSAAVEYSHRYLSGRQLPDKAVSVLDTTCTRIALSQSAHPAAVEDAHRRVSALETTREILMREQKFGISHGEEIAEIDKQLELARGHQEELNQRWNRENDLVASIRDLRQQLIDSNSDETELTTLQNAMREKERELAALQGDAPLVHPCVNANAIAGTIENWTGIPVGQMVSEEILTVLNLKSKLEEHVVGQSHAMDAIAKSIVTWRGEMHDPNKPAGVFLLCGSSGVGKTETALTLARLLFGSDDSVVTIEMSQLKSAEMAQTKLFGASAGYVGYGEGGLMESIRRKPYCVVLLDEFEKAHESVQHLFYNIFDRGFAQDSDGGEIDFRNTITLITTNAATDLIMDLCADPETAPDAEGFREAVFPSLLQSFEPAFLGRINAIIPYYPLTKPVLSQIVDLKLSKVVSRAAKKYGAILEFSPAVRELMVTRCSNTDTGARNIDHILSKSILPEISARFLSSLVESKAIDRILVDVGADEDFIFN